MVARSLGRVLIIDDEKNITLVIQAMLERAGYEAVALNDSREALEIIGSEDFDAVVSDLFMPGLGGMEILDHCKKHRADLPVVIMTAFGTVEAAVAALKRGAFDFVTKPFDQAELLNVVKKAVRTQQKREKDIVPSMTGAGGMIGMIGESSQMLEVFKVISKIANSPATVMIWGESGTGKELVAFEIHRNSDRTNKPFIKINCAAIPATLIESEFFGYEKGAFTGAVSSKPGRFELADEGTLFLDEVAEMPLEMQVKLLRVLQEQEFERVGGVSTIKVNVRIVTATNKDLEAEVKAGRFREDLFYRLNVVPIRLPALRDRADDIGLLIDFFIKQFNDKLKKNIAGVSPETLRALKAYSWPGNIRQLENALERMILMAEGSVLKPEDLPEEIALATGAWDQVPADSELSSTSEDGAPVSFKEIVKRKTQSVERDLIEKALEETGGNVTRAAEKLGLSRKGLQLKIKELGLVRE